MSQVDVSVVIPVLNEATTLPVLMRSLEQQTLRPIEVIVVDGGSQDSTCDWVTRYAAETGGQLAVRLLQLQGSRPGRGRNAGVTAATTEIVACSDAGTELHPEWLAHLVAGVNSDPGTDVAVGTFVARGVTPFERYVGSMLVRPARRVKLLYAGGVSIAFRKSAWERVGGYPDDVYPCEDALFLRRLDTAGIAIARASEALTFWRPRASLVALARQYRSYAWGDAMISLGLRRHLLRMGFYAVCVALLVGVLGPAGRWLAAGLLLAYLFVSTARAWRADRAAAIWWWGPLILLAKDWSQMFGYLEGHWNRLRRGSRDFGRRGR